MLVSWRELKVIIQFGDVIINQVWNKSYWISKGVGDFTPHIIEFIWYHWIYACFHLIYTPLNILLEFG